MILDNFRSTRYAVSFRHGAHYKARTTWRSVGLRDRNKERLYRQKRKRENAPVADGRQLRKQFIGIPRQTPIARDRMVSELHVSARLDYCPGGGPPGTGVTGAPPAGGGPGGRCGKAALISASVCCAKASALARWPPGSSGACSKANSAFCTCRRARRYSWYEPGPPASCARADQPRPMTAARAAAAQSGRKLDMKRSFLGVLGMARNLNLTHYPRPPNRASDRECRPARRATNSLNLRRCFLFSPRILTHRKGAE
jgi:hypothetical protein